MNPLEPSLGREMLISCWHCSLSLMRLTVGEGAQLLTCGRCALVTRVTVSRDEERWALKCEDGSTKKPRPEVEVG